MKTIRAVWHKLSSQSNWKKNWLTYFTLWSWLLYFAWIWYQQFIFKDDGVYAGWVGSWADGAVHLTYASRFAFGPFGSYQLPVYAQHPFTYAFVADMLTGLTTKFTGISIFLSHQLWGFVLTALVIYLLFRFYRKITHSKTVATLALSLFFLSGGFGFKYFYEDIKTQGFFTTITRLPRQYTHLPDQGLEWINLISGELIPQRAMLLGLIVGLLLLTWYWQIVTDKRSFAPRDFLVMGLVLGLLPIIHPHTFMVMTGLGVWSLLLTVRRLKFKWAYFVLPAVGLSLVLISIFVSPATEAGFISWKLGWLAPKHNLSSLSFWLLNWGLFLPLAFVGIVKLSSKQRLFLFPFLVLFVLANLWIFQPYDWDNTKLFTWVHLAFSISVAQLLVSLSRRSVTRILVPVLVLVLVASGGLDALRLLDIDQNIIPMYATEELLMAEKIKADTEPTSLFLTSDRHSHPVPTLTGRQILMGYRGWLWTYGITDTQRAADVAAMYAGGVQAENLFNQYQVDYVVIGPHEQQTLAVNQNYFSQNHRLWYQSDNYFIYHVNR